MGENKWESSRILDSNGLDIAGTEYSIFLRGKAYPNVGNWKWGIHFDLHSPYGLVETKNWVGNDADAKGELVKRLKDNIQMYSMCWTFFTFVKDHFTTPFQHPLSDLWGHDVGSSLILNSPIAGRCEKCKQPKQGLDTTLKTLRPDLERWIYN